MAGTLSPSRAGDFMQCPLLYRFRVIDRLPEKPRPEAVRGTLVHAVLERVFDLPAHGRTPAAARDLVATQWDRLRTENPETESIFAETIDPGRSAAEPAGPDRARVAPDPAGWLSSAADLVERWFTLEDPTRLEPADRELPVRTVLDDGLVLRGYVDRLDVSADGRLRLVDYKTGRAPAEPFEARALFQLKFYALLLWRTRGRMPEVLQLVYLGDGEILRHRPDEAELLAVERKVRAIWEAIEVAARTEEWHPSPGPLCAWCDHRSRCPAKGGTPPPIPPDALDRLLNLSTEPGAQDRDPAAAPRQTVAQQTGR